MENFTAEAQRSQRKILNLMIGAGLPTAPSPLTAGLLPVNWRPAVAPGARSGDLRTTTEKNSGPLRSLRLCGENFVCNLLQFFSW